jgi:hypothetical protein
MKQAAAELNSSAALHCRAVSRLKPLLPEGAVPMKPAALKKSVTHHAVAEQKKDDCQDNYKQELPRSERRRPLSFGVWRL